MSVASQNRRINAMFGSGLLHTGFFALVLLMKLNSPQDFKKEIIEIQVGENTAALVQPSQDLSALPDLEIEKAKSEVQEKGTEIKPVAKSKVSIQKVVDTQVDTSDLDSALAAPVAVAADDFQDSDLNEQLDQVDAQSDEKMISAVAAFDAESADALKETESLATAAQVEQKEKINQQAKELASIRAEKTKNELAKIKAAQLAEKQARMAAEQAEREARAAALAQQEQLVARERQAAEEAAAASAAQELKNQQHASSGSHSGSSEKSEVRSLAELRQVPGNQHPQYDSSDRLARRSGIAIFHAYIAQSGAASEFKLIQSSGHRTLDLKTLKAIRDWKFYPGQEGWVEIPFQWDLKGEPRAIGGTLRKISQK